MLVVLLRREHRYTLDGLFEWAPRLRKLVRVLAYEDLREHEELCCRAIVFSDLERLTRPQLAAARDLATRLAAAEPGVRVLNDPRRTLRRYELLRRLHQEGVNDFRVFRLLELPSDLRFPAFIRNETDHEGPRSVPLSDRKHLDAVVARLRAQERDLSDFLLVEFCDVSDTDGLFHKYSAWVVDGEPIPRDVNFSRRWSLKDEDLYEPRLRAVEEQLFERNPHADRLLEIARRAKADYGRFDYAVKDGRVQVWELNTNPVFKPRLDEYLPERLGFERAWRDRVAAALERLATARPELRVRIGGPIDGSASF